MSIHNMHAAARSRQRCIHYGASLEGSRSGEAVENTMAFMFETRFPQHLTKFAAETETLQQDYMDCWSGIQRQFDGTP